MGGAIPGVNNTPNYNSIFEYSGSQTEYRTINASELHANSGSSNLKSTPS